EFRALLGTLGATKPALEAGGPWAVCAATGIYMLDCLGHSRDVGGLIEEFGAVARTDPSALASFHGISALRSSYAEENLSKAVYHGEMTSEVSTMMNRERGVGIAKITIGMNRWYLGASEDVQRTMTEVTLPDEETGWASSLRSFTMAWLLADHGT